MTEWDETDDDKTPVDPNPPSFGPPKLRSTPELEESRAQANRELELAFRVQQLEAQLEQERGARERVEVDRARLLDEINRLKRRK